jgi:uncharacterized protein YggL (DUF469 family)
VSKGLREKLRAAEFVQWYIEVTVRLPSQLTDEAAERWFQRMEHQVLPEHDLCWLSSFCGSHSETMTLCHDSRHRQITEDQRVWLAAWLAKQPEVVDYAVGAVTACEP